MSGVRIASIAFVIPHGSLLWAEAPNTPTNERRKDSEKKK